MNPNPRSRFAGLARLVFGAAGLSLAAWSAQADDNVVFSGVAAGDATSTDVILWTRAQDTNNPAATALTAQVALDNGFASLAGSFPVSTVVTNDYTAKVAATGLTANTRYYYRFTDGTNYSNVGTFKTVPSPTAPVAVHFGFSGDVDGLMRPYVLAQDFPRQNFDFFAFVGDTIYETASGSVGHNNSPAVTSTASATQTQLFNDFSRKYREQFIPVNAGGQPGLQPFFASQVNYTLYDNHELGNKQYINGGAPAGPAVGGMPSGAGYDGTATQYDVNATGTFMNKSLGFQTLERVFLNYQPIRDRGLISAPTDLNTDGTPQLYSATQWGKNVILVNTDTRTYRDIRLKVSGNDDTGARAANPNRTLFGATQLAWVEQTLLAAQQAGTPWKFVVISDPIDQLGPIGGALNVTNGGNNGYAAVASDGGKSWMGGYRAERNKFLKFIADNHINNVVFLTTDDHQNRVNELLYSTNSQTEAQGTYAPVPHCFEIVDGPLGATGPNLVTNHTFVDIKSIVDSLASAQSANGIDPVGLSPNFPGLHDVVRESDPLANTLRQPADFYSPDTYNYNTLDVSADGKTLTVKSIGVNSTAVNAFTEYDPTYNPARQVFGFQVDAVNDFAGINHFIVVYQENWSFDSLYGSFPGANGIANASATSLNQLDRVSGNSIASLPVYDPASNVIPTNNPPVPLNGTLDPHFLATNSVNGNITAIVNTLAPYDLSAYISATNLTGDIVHRYWQEQFQIDGGNMDKFVTWSDNPGLVMSHFDASSLPEGLLAQQYTMCDDFFHSAFGGSFLNHQFLVAAAAPVYPNAASLIPNNVAALDASGLLSLNPSTYRLVRDGNITPIGGTVYSFPGQKFDKNYAVNTIQSQNLPSSGSPLAATYLPSLNDSNPGDTNRPYTPTIGDALDNSGVSWKWYSGGWDRALNYTSINPAHYGVTGVDTNTPAISLFQWHHQALAFYDNYAPWTNGVRNARSAAHLQDENNFFADVSNSTLPSVSFIKPFGPDNEHPGYASLLQGQQHVAAIVAAVKANPALWAHTAIIITYDEHGGRWDHVAPPARDIWGPGARVPAIVISPLAKTNYVDHTQYDTTAILTTIEKRFGVSPLNALDAASPTLANSFTAAAAEPEPTTPPQITFGKTASALTLSWPAAYTSYVLQVQTNAPEVGLSNNWVNVTGVSNNAASISIDNSQPAVFYRLAKVAN